MTLADRIQGEILRLNDGRKVRRSFEMGEDTVFVRVFDEFDDHEGDPQPMPATTPVVEIIEARNHRGMKESGRGVDESDPLRRKTGLL